MSTRLQLFEVAVDQLYGVEPPPPEKVLSVNIGAVFGLIMTLPYYTNYMKEVIKGWKHSK